MTYTNGTMTLPKNAVVMDREEMRYVEGGFGIPKSWVANAINWGLGALLGGIGGSLLSAARKYLSRVGKTLFSKTMKRKLMTWGLSAGVAGSICGIVATAINITGAIGDWVANYWDAHDCDRNDGWCDF